MHVYPIFLNNLNGQRCVVIGSGHEAERKVQGLLECGAAVTMISPDLSAGLKRAVEEDEITWVPRAYQDGDLKGVFLVIVAETNPEATAPIWGEAQAEKVLINAMDDVPHCSFVAGSVIRRGPLVVSISTSGAAPAYSVRLRQKLEQELQPEHGLFLEWMRDLRDLMATRFPDFEDRRARWYELVDSDILDLLIAGDTDTAHQRIEEIIRVEVPAVA